MIGTVEQSIITRLTALSDSGALGYKFRQVKTYGGEAKDEQTRARISAIPAAWLAFDGADKPDRYSGKLYRLLRFWLLIATQNLRNEQAARHGAEGEVGAYQIVTDMDGILSGWTPEGACKAIETGRIMPLSVEEKGNGLLAVYGLELFVPVFVPRQMPELDLTNPLETIHIDWDIPPTGNVGPDLPDDENADAISHIQGD